jgi:HK97 family phage major capsid protein
MTLTNPRRVGNRWVFLTGQTLPVISGGDPTDPPVTVQALRDQRAQFLNDIDVILDAAKEAKRDLTDQERVDHDALVASVEGEWEGEGPTRHIVKPGLDQAIAAAVAKEADTGRFSNQETRRSANFPVPNVNVRGSGSVGANVTRDLDDMLWATAPTVMASNGRSQVDVERVSIRSSVNDAGRAAPRINDFRPQDRDVIREFQGVVATMALAGMMVDKDADTSAKGFQVMRDQFRSARPSSKVAELSDRYNRILAAMDVDTAAEGTEWVPTGIGATLHEQVRASGKVAALFPRIDLPTNPWKWPIEGADLTAYRVAEPTTDTASKVTASTAGSAAATFDAEIFGARTLWSRSLDADSAIAIAPYQQMKLVQAFVDAEEKAILDGDADGAHQDTDVQALGATDVRSAWDGLRKKGIAQTTATATACGVDELATVRASMGKWGVNPANLAFIIGVSNMYDLLADDKVITVDKFGPNATVHNGQIAQVHGVPVIVSEHVREDLNASGVDDGITATKTYMLCVNRNEWAMGQRMALDVMTNDVLYLETFQRVAVAFMREDFQHIGTAATNDDTAIAYNVTP